MDEAGMHRVRGFPVIDACLAPGGVPLPLAAQIAGQTPFFVYDRSLMSRRVAALRAALPDRLSLHYAVKANPMPAVAGHMARLVDGLDIASDGELRLALATGIAPADISFAGPGKSDAELAAAVAAGVRICVESPGELHRIQALRETLGVTPRLAVRINPAFELKGAGMKMGGGSKPFGVDEEALPAFAALARDLGLAVDGVHIFAGSQALDAETVSQVQGETLALAAKAAEQLAAGGGPALRWANLGGGFGVPYFPTDKALDLAAVGQALAGRLADLPPALAQAELVLELGRYLVAEAGLYVCRILDVKRSRGRTILVTDGGLHHQLAASGNFGQVFRKNYPVAIGTRIGQENAGDPVDVVGCLCTPLDRLADKVDLPAAEPGDLFVVFQSGAYGRSASPEAFLGHSPAPELLLG